MSYVFDVSSEHNDLLEVNSFVLYRGHGDYKGLNRRDDKGHTIYNVEFFDRRYALQFKLKFNATVVLWDESDDQEIVTIQELLDRGYEALSLRIRTDYVEAFREWCEEKDFPIVDEVKFIRDDLEPMLLYVPGSKKSHIAMLAKLRWGADEEFR